MVRLLLVSLLCLTGGCNLVAGPGGDEPLLRRAPPEEIPAIIRSIPSHATFDYSGVCFFDGKLYAATNVGLLVVEGGKPSGLYKWYDRHDVLSGPWPDPADGLLWARHERLDKLLRYDGKTWAVVEQPQPKEGFMRGDILAGFRGTGTPEGFWLEGGRYAWRWNAQSAGWEEVQTPREGHLARVVPLPGVTLLIMRHQELPFLFKKGDEFNSDTVHYYDGGWKQVPNNTGKSFFAEQVVVVKDAAYVRTGQGELLLLTPAGVAVHESPGECEALTATTAGTLLAGFSKLGIFEYTNGWQKRFASPYADTEPERWAYLAEANGQVAFAITAKPAGEGGAAKRPGQTTLWVSRGETLEAVIPGAGK